MKTLLFTIALFAGFSAQALTVNSAEIVGENLEVSVSYGGGCEEHKFEMSVGMCLESYPVQCMVTISDVSEKPDFCEAYLTETLKFNLEEHGLNDGYFNGASLRINNSTVVRLPFVQ